MPKYIKMLYNSCKIKQQYFLNIVNTVLKLSFQNERGGFKTNCFIF